MVSTEEADDLLFKKHQNLVNNLKIDEATASQAWNSYNNIRTNYTLEGDQLHWLGCAIFVACRRQTTPTLSGNVVEGNLVNLTSLLRHCNLSLRHFFDKIEKWVDMAALPDSFRQKIEVLEANFSVSCNIFRQYVPMFAKIFREPTEADIGNRHRNRKQKSLPCTPAQLFEFGWLLFITAKGEDPSCSVDLVVSVHFLLACCDLLFKNLLLDDRRDLLNPEFEGLPKNFISNDYIIPEEAPCIIDKLCEADTQTEAKYVKRYSWNELIQKLFKIGDLVGDKINFTGILNQSNFEVNYKNLTKAYEAHLLHKGDFDERIFLAEHRRRLIIREQSINNTSSNGNTQHNLNESGESETSRTSYSEIRKKIPDTPLTNRQYLGPREEGAIVVKLQVLINGRSAGPSETLQDIFRTCTVTPQDRIESVLETLGQRFIDSFHQESEFAQQRLQFATKLFYTFLEYILLHEQTINSDISRLVQQDRLYQCLFTCSLEIVINAYNSPRRFPWILQALSVQASHFIRVIELIVRLKSLSLPRETVKHLNRIEEMILDSEIWKSGCLFWEELKKPGLEIPKFEDIALPGTMIYGQMSSRISDPSDKPTNPLTSPGPSAVDTFDSPISHVKKQLFPVRPGQSVLSQNQKTASVQHFMVTDQDGNKKIIPFIDAKLDIQINQTTPSPVRNDPQRPKKTGSINIIFRKIYNLAGARLDHLCSSLRIFDNELKCKIWTAFEHCLRTCAEILRDRHLDQLLMCSVYVICKATNNEKTFSEIMQSYKLQPQANNYIYRNVLLYRKNEEDEKGEMLSEDRRDNLIQFYNLVFVKHMKNFAVRFSNTSTQNAQVKLSPMPSIKCLLASPSHQIGKNIFIKTHESPVRNIASSNKSYNYVFSRSASKDLKDINKAINNNGVSTKRLLIDSSTFELLETSKRFCSNRKVQTLLEERRNQISE